MSTTKIHNKGQVTKEVGLTATQVVIDIMLMGMAIVLAGAYIICILLGYGVR